MDRIVERSYACAASSSLPPAGETETSTAKMAPSPVVPLQLPSASEIAAADPASPAGIAQAVVTLLGPTLAATVDAAAYRGLEQLHIEVQAQAQRLTQTEERISSLEDESTATSAMLARITTTNRDIWDKLDDLENCLRRNNLRIIGLPELVTTLQLTNICAKIISVQLGLRILCSIERAHRIGQYSDSCAKPSHVIVKYLNYADKNAIMQKSGRSCSLSVDGAKLLLFADYSVEVMNRRKAFSDMLHSTT